MILDLLIIFLKNLDMLKSDSRFSFRVSGYDIMRKKSNIYGIIEIKNTHFKAGILSTKIIDKNADMDEPIKEKERVLPYTKVL